MKIIPCLWKVLDAHSTSCNVLAKELESMSVMLLPKQISLHCQLDMAGLHPCKAPGWTEKHKNAIIVKITAASLLNFSACPVECMKKDTPAWWGVELQVERGSE